MVKVQKGKIYGKKKSKNEVYLYTSLRVMQLKVQKLKKVRMARLSLADSGKTKR